MTMDESPPNALDCAGDFAGEQARRMEAERRLAEHRQSLARLVHDFRSPLNAIAGFAEIMADARFGPLGDPRYAEYARDIRMAALQLAETVADMLDGAKFEAGRFRLEDERLSLREIVEGCAHMFKGLAAPKRIAIDCEFRTDIVVLADRRALRQILINLVSNAVKFSEPNASVAILVDRDAAGRPVLAVTDTGCGIALEDIARIKVPYARSTRGSGGEIGTGLGLSIVTSLVELHGGTLEIESALGKGTCVRVVLPEWRGDGAARAALGWRAWP